MASPNPFQGEEKHIMAFQGRGDRTEKLNMMLKRLYDIRQL